MGIVIPLALQPLHAPNLHSPRTQHRVAAAGSRLGDVRWIYRGLAFWPPRETQHAARVHTPLFTNYALRTRSNEKASIRFVDGTALHINSNTDAVLTSHLTYVRNGEVAEYLQPGTQHHVQTGTADASAIGTTFDVRTNGGTTTLVVLHGALQVQGAGGSVLVKSNQETVVVGSSAPTPPTHVDAQAVFAWTDQIPTPDLGEDVALDANGGAIVRVSSQRRAERWHADHADDGLLSLGWESAQGKVKNQFLALGFSPSRLYRIFEVILDPAATGGDPSSMDLRQFQIRVSSTGTASSDFTTVFTGSCRRKARLQIFKLPTPVLAKFVELVATSNYGSSRGVAVAEFEAVANVAGMAFPSGLAVGRGGNIFVADTGNDRILKLNPDGKPLAAWGSKGSAAGKFNTPIGLALDRKGDIYVVDSHNDRIQVLSPRGKPLLHWGGFGTGPGKFSLPYDLALDAKGNVYVTDSNNNRIQKFTARGKFLAEWGSPGGQPGQFEAPFGIALDLKGHVFVTDYGNARVQELSGAGRPLRVWGHIGTRPGQFSQPEAIGVDRSGSVYVADTFNNRVQKFSPKGKFLGVSRATRTRDDIRPAGITIDSRGRVFVSQYGNSHIVRMSAALHREKTIGVFGTTPQLLAFPIGVAVDNAGTVYVTDPLNGRIQLRSPRGSVQAVYGHRALLAKGAILRPGEFGYPIGIAVNTAGLIYVPDQDLHRIVVLSASGPLGFIGTDGTARWIAVDASGDLYILDMHNFIEKLSPQGRLLATLATKANLNRPQGLAVDADGNVYVADSGNDARNIPASIIRFSATGAETGRLGRNAGLNAPQGIAVDPAGNIYVADTGNNRIVKLSTDGEVAAVLGQSVRFNVPTGVAVDKTGAVYVADKFNDRLVKLFHDGSLAAVWS
jgi:DNA-binding beta-propeller fold protein YncE